MLAAPAEPCVQRRCASCARKQRQGSRNNRHSPREWFYGLYVFSSVRRAVWPPSPCASLARLDPSVGGSGPHDFAVRKNAFVGAPKRAEHPHVHRIPLPTSVTIAIRPSSGGGTGAYNHEIPKNGRDIFFAGGLDVSGCWFGLGEVICPTGKPYSVVIPGRASWREPGIHNHDCP
jgi:hypothetical protein